MRDAGETLLLRGHRSASTEKGHRRDPERCGFHRFTCRNRDCFTSSTQKALSPSSWTNVSVNLSGRVRVHCFKEEQIKPDARYYFVFIIIYCPVLTQKSSLHMEPTWLARALFHTPLSLQYLTPSDGYQELLFAVSLRILVYAMRIKDSWIMILTVLPS